VLAWTPGAELGGVCRLHNIAQKRDYQRMEPSDERRAFLARTRLFIERTSGGSRTADPAAVASTLASLGDPVQAAERERARLAAERSERASAGTRSGLLRRPRRRDDAPDAGDGPPAGDQGAEPSEPMPQIGGRPLTGEYAKKKHRSIASRWRPGQPMQRPTRPVRVPPPRKGGSPPSKPARSPDGAEPGGQAPAGAEPGGQDPASAEPGGQVPVGGNPAGQKPGGPGAGSAAAGPAPDGAVTSQPAEPSNIAGPPPERPGAAGGGPPVQVPPQAAGPDGPPPASGSRPAAAGPSGPASPGATTRRGRLDAMLSAYVLPEAEPQPDAGPQDAGRQDTGAEGSTGLREGTGSRPDTGSEQGVQPREGARPRPGAGPPEGSGLQEGAGLRQDSGLSDEAAPREDNIGPREETGLQEDTGVRGDEVREDTGPREDTQPLEVAEPGSTRPLPTARPQPVRTSTRRQPPQRPQPPDFPASWAGRVAYLFRRHRLEGTAVVLLALSGLLYPWPIWVLGFALWVIGFLVAVPSRLWTLSDKWIGLVGPVALVIVGTPVSLMLGGSYHHLNPYVHEALANSAILIKVGALLGAGYLAWRVYRGPRAPMSPPWNRPHRV
jgi:hypothetical protein